MFPLEIALKLGVVAALVFVAFKMKALDKSGMLAALVVGFVIVQSMGWSWLILLIAFFVLATIFTKFKYEFKRSLGWAQEKGGARSWTNTLANGLVPAFAAVAEYWTQSIIFVAAFVGALATSTGDTLATEVGLLSRSKPRLITNLKKKVPHGTSGGITPLGELMVLVGSMSIGLIATALQLGYAWHHKLIVVATVSGFVGSTVDSILGATIQGINRCNVCQQLTESLRHHGVPTINVRGLRFFDNNIVNLVSCVAGALTAILLIQVL